MTHPQENILENSGSFMPHSPISYWIDLVQRTSFLIKALRTQNSLDWPWCTLTIQLNLHWGMINVCPLLVVTWFNQNEVLVHCTFRFCCVRARPSPELLQDLCGFNLAAHLNSTYYSLWDPRISNLMCWFGRQVCWFCSVNALPRLMRNIYNRWVQTARKPCSIVTKQHLMDGFKHASCLYPPHHGPITISQLLHFWISSTSQNLTGSGFRWFYNAGYHSPPLTSWLIYWAGRKQT